MIAIRIAVVFLFVTLSCGLFHAWAVDADPATPPTPPAPPPPLYTAPRWQTVLNGKAPIRLLMTSRVNMLAWKGNATVKTVDLDTGKVLHSEKANTIVGLVYADEGKTCTLRQNSKNFCGVPGPIRLESSKPIKLWTPTPDTWAVYPNPIIVMPLGDGAFSISQEMMLEDYLLQVVPAEMPKYFHPQALRAQAVVARTYTLSKLGRHADEGADICATVHCQAFGGENYRSKATDDAVRATRGLTLLAGDELAVPYYHSCCGGVTDDAGYLWGPEYARPYLHNVPDTKPVKSTEPPTVQQTLAKHDAFCQESGSFRWIKQFTAGEVNTLVARNLSKVTGDGTVEIRRVTNMVVEERTPGGRVATLRVEGDGASVLVYGDKVRWLFGDGEPGASGLWSTLFDLTVVKDQAGNITRYFLRGGGRGHGIGLCQWGANGRAKAGQTFRDILHAYYPGTKLSD